MTAYLSWLGTPDPKEIVNNLKDLGFQREYVDLKGIKDQKQTVALHIATGVMPKPPGGNELKISKSILDGEDMNSLSSIVAEESVGYYTDPIASINGRTIFGDDVPYDEMPLEDGELDGKSFYVDGQGGVVARKEGYLSKTAKGTHFITEELVFTKDLKNLDIDYSHKVTFMGDVENCRITADSINAMKVIKNSRVKTKGDVFVGDGIHGGEGSEIGGNLSAPYLNSFIGYVSGNLEIRSTIFGSKIFAKKINSIGAKVSESCLVSEEDLLIKEVGGSLNDGQSILAAGLDQRGFDVIHNLPQELRKMAEDRQEAVIKKKKEDAASIDGAIKFLKDKANQEPGYVSKERFIECFSGIKIGSRIVLGDLDQEIPMDIDYRVRFRNEGGEFAICEVS